MLKLTITHAGDPIPPLTDAELATMPEDMRAQYIRARDAGEVQTVESGDGWTLEYALPYALPPRALVRLRRLLRRLR